ncbi:MAG: roadblock/LC7 domain-containing protein [Candidatus Helarchaeota archaeon]|jgi:predicted regulator of Ras-like GTPase activity (Roadblock/LC7/MglB family)|nr:roadblock/LC7 domain-containing protein [Candidatus Helarchaeota archaeon]
MDVKSFDRILAKIIKAEPGIKKVILADRTGLTIAHVSKFSYYPVDVDGIGAIASAVFCASEEQGKSLDIGNLQIVTSEFDDGKIFASNTGQGAGSSGVLCIITDKDVNIGMIRLVMKSASSELDKVLAEFLGEKPPIEAEAGKDEEADLKNALGELDKI